MKRIIQFFIFSLVVLFSYKIYSDTRIIDVQSYGSDLAKAVVAAHGKTILISVPTKTLTANLVIPSDIDLDVKNGGVITCGSYTVTGLKKSNPVWFGAKFDGGTTDDLTAFVKSAASLTTGGTLEIPRMNSYAKVSDVVTISTPSVLIDVRGEVRSSDSTKSLFNVTSSDVTFDGSGTLASSGTFTRASSNYPALIKFQGTNTTTGVIKNSTVRNINMNNPPCAGVYFLYANGGKVEGVTFKGGPSTDAGGSPPNSFDILGVDSVNTIVTGNYSYPGDDGGNVDQFFDNSNAILSDTPSYTAGNFVFDTWDKLLYQQSDGATVIGNYHKKRTGTSADNRQSIKCGSRCIAAHNNVEGAILAFGSREIKLVDNFVSGFSYVGLGVIADPGSTETLTDVLISGNTVSANNSADFIYSAIEVQSPTGQNMENIAVTYNNTIGGDLRNGPTTTSAKLGTLLIDPNGGTGKKITCKGNIMKNPGYMGLLAHNIEESNFSENTCVNAGNDTSGDLVACIEFNTYLTNSDVYKNKGIDDRGGSSRLAYTLLTYGSGTFTNNRAKENICSGISAGGGCISVGNPYAASTRWELSGNKIGFEPLSNVITLTTVTSVIIPNTGIYHATYPTIRFTPRNATAWTEEAGTSHLYYGGTAIPGTGFLLETYDGGNMSNGAEYFYEIIQ